MNMNDYRTCMSSGLKGKKLSKEERKLEFCIQSRLCSNKSKDRIEAEKICSLPKEPKEPKADKPTKKRKRTNCPQEMAELANCIAPQLEMAPAILTEILQKCACGKVSATTKAERIKAEMPVEQQEALAVMAQMKEAYGDNHWG